MRTSTWQTTSTITKIQPQPWVVSDKVTSWFTTSTDTLTSLSTVYDPISLEQMEAVALMDRTETKFVMTTMQLRTALAALQSDYWILSVDGQRLNHYRTLYFDTPAFDLYLMHVNGRANRYKVRCREYTDSQLSFLEVKHRTPKDRTIKERLSTTHPLNWITAEAEDWLQSVYPFECQTLEPKLWNTFTRLTLVNKELCERVTLDVDLCFFTGQRKAKLDNIAIAEVKMDRQHCQLPFMAQMHRQRIHPRGFSKYCIGVGLLHDNVKKNALKPKLLWLNKLAQGVAANE